VLKILDKNGKVKYVLGDEDPIPQDAIGYIYEDEEEKDDEVEEQEDGRVN
jgi:hypothetical protein